MEKERKRKGNGRDRPPVADLRSDLFEGWVQVELGEMSSGTHVLEQSALRYPVFHPCLRWIKRSGVDGLHKPKTAEGKEF